jgi:hypothetical protein
MSQLTLIVVSNQAINKGTVITGGNGGSEQLKESMSHIVLSDGKSELKTILPYTEGKKYEIGEPVTVKLEKVKR